MYYILGTDLRLLWSVSIQDPMYNSDHYMVLGFLYSTSLGYYSRYLGGHRRPPLQPP